MIEWFVIGIIALVAIILIVVKAKDKSPTASNSRYPSDRNVRSFMK